MAVILYCSWDDCKKGLAPVGEIPTMCPECKRETTWHAAPFAFTRDDRIFLKQNKIAAD